MSWQPATESLQQLAACLKDSLSGFDKNAQKQADLVRRPVPVAIVAPTLGLTMFLPADAPAGQDLA
jgi:hypothetical protein